MIQHWEPDAMLELLGSQTGVSANEADRVSQILDYVLPYRVLFRPHSPKELLTMLKLKFPILDDLELERTTRVLAAFGGLLNIMNDFVPSFKKRSEGDKLLRDFWKLLPILFLLEYRNQMEKKLKEAYNGLKALGTGKTTDTDCISLFPGRFRKLLKVKAQQMLHFRNSTSKKAAMLISSIFESKRLWTAMSECLKLEAREKHKCNFTRVEELSAEAEEYILYAVNLIVPPGTKYSPGSCVPTYSACVEGNYASGGNHSYMAHLYNSKVLFDEGDVGNQLFRREGMFSIPGARSKDLATWEDHFEEPYFGRGSKKLNQDYNRNLKKKQKCPEAIASDFCKKKLSELLAAGYKGVGDIRHRQRYPHEYDSYETCGCKGVCPDSGSNCTTRTTIYVWKYEEWNYKMKMELRAKERDSQPDTSCSAGPRIEYEYAQGDLQKINFKNHSKKLYDLLESDFSKVENRIIFMPLQEAGKFRIITKGPSVLYTGFRPLQRFLLDRWKRSPYATMKDDRLVDEKILKMGDLMRKVEQRNNDLIQKVQNEITVREMQHLPVLRERKYLERLKDRSGIKMVSGDYDSATDRMKLQATLACLSRILQNLDIIDTPLGYHAMRSFADTKIEYPEIELRDGQVVPKEVVQATNGQPMGHPLSFPLLCIINLSTYLRVTGWRMRPGPLMNIPINRCIINGDDILFLGTEIDYGKWREFAGDVGLVVNEMKTYFSDRFAVINSRFFDTELRYRIEYSRYSLAFNHNVKKDNTDGEERFADAGKDGGPEGLAYLRDVWDKIINESPSFSRKSLIRIFLRTYNKLLSHVGIPSDRVPNLFVAKELGGVGIKPIDGFKFRISMYQRQLATYLIRRPKLRYFIEAQEIQRIACSEAVKLTAKLMPDPVPWLLDGLRVEGPIQQGKSYDELFDETLSRCIGAFAYKVGKRQCTRRYDCPDLLRKKGIRLEAPMSTATIRNFLPALLLW